MATFNAKEIATIEIALIGWIVRCRNVARDMRKMAEEHPDMAEKCYANVAASDALRADAEAVMNAIAFECGEKA